MTNVKNSFEQGLKKADLRQFIICLNNVLILITAIGD
jgi:hypothetical protein